MKKDFVIIFDGDNHHKIMTADFFQDKLIQDKGVSDIFTLYQATRVYENTLKTVLELDESKRIDLPSNKEIPEEYIYGVKQGREILSNILEDLAGSTLSAMLKTKLEQLIIEAQEEVTEDE